jgi:hypothetical protein
MTITPPVVIPTTDKPTEETVTLTPVPPDDISRFAKPKCSLCYGLGKLTIKDVGSETSKSTVCNCALKRFIAANRDILAVNRNRELFYRSVPESLSPSDEGDGDVGGEVLTVAVTGNEDGAMARFKVAMDRVAVLDSELAAISGSYNNKKEPLLVKVVEAEVNLKNEQTERDNLLEARKAAEKAMVVYDDRVAKLEEELQLARAEMASTADILVTIDGELAYFESRLAPYYRALDDANEAVSTLEKKRHQAVKPYEQRKASLLKRVQHRAASMGLSLDDIKSKLGIKSSEIV